MIATRDIASAAAGLLLDLSWRGHQIRGLHGPADLSLLEAAEEISRGVGRPVRYEQVSEEQTEHALREAGAGEDFIHLAIEMYRGLDMGWLKLAEPRTPRTTTPTSLEQFAREEMACFLREETAASRG